MRKKNQSTIRAYRQLSLSDEESNNLKVGDKLPSEFNEINIEDYKLKWYEAEENLFGIRIFDCRKFAIGTLTSTTDKKILKNFEKSRMSSGLEYIEALPHNSIKINVDLKFDLEDIESREIELPDGALFKAGRMEEKWDIYKYKNNIFFVRSWTSELVYVSDYIPTMSGFEISYVYLGYNEINKDNPFFGLKVVEFLVYSHILRVQFPHPIPKEIENDSEMITKFSFSLFGDLGYYAAII